MADIADKHERWRYCLQAGTAPEGHLPRAPGVSGLLASTVLAVWCLVQGLHSPPQVWTGCSKGGRDRG